MRAASRAEKATQLRGETTLRSSLELVLGAVIEPPRSRESLPPCLYQRRSLAKLITASNETFVDGCNRRTPRIFSDCASQESASFPRKREPSPLYEGPGVESPGCRDLSRAAMAAQEKEDVGRHAARAETTRSANSSLVRYGESGLCRPSSHSPHPRVLSYAPSCRGLQC
jgi:hypothetical protein